MAPVTHQIYTLRVSGNAARTSAILGLIFLTAGSLTAKTKPEAPVIKVSEKRRVAEGVEFWKEQTTTTSGPLELRVLKINLATPGYYIHSQPGAGRLFTGQTPKAVEARLESAGMDVLASMNADFWKSNEPGRVHRPVGLHVTDSILATTTTNRSALIMDENRIPHISVVDLSVKAKLADQTLDIADLNNNYTTNGLILFTSAYGSTVTAYTTRPLVLVSSTEPGPSVDTPFNGKVLEVLTTGHAQPTPTTVLLAANHDITLPEIGPQSPVTINSTLLNHKGKVTAAVGGGPRIVHQGNNTAKADTIAEKVGKSFSSLRHPRTAVGISKDRETMWWVIADGRRPDYSVGVSLPDFAEHMIRYGAYEAINLDGGGSSSMVVEGEVVNWPSDKTARPVANTIHLVRKK